MNRQLAGSALTPELGIDGALSPEAATVDLIEALNEAGPFGSGNPRPRFVFPSVATVNTRVVGTDHVSCFLVAQESQRRLKAIAFRAAGTEVGDALLNARGGVLHIAGHLNIDAWQGDRKPQLIIEDAARVR